ncbi:MAG: hypothetical protein WCO86_17690 [Planctomycetota bacterium]
MTRFACAFAAVLAIAPMAGLADERAPAGTSVVHVVFITSRDWPMGTEARDWPMGAEAHDSLMPMGMEAMDPSGAMPQKQAVMAGAGHIVDPTESLRPIRVSIDGDFVGHALVGILNIDPEFNLPAGKHKFTFEFDGGDPVAAEIRVLANSRQYLVIKLPSKNSETEDVEANATADN